MSMNLSNDPCNCAHCRMNKLEALTVDLKAAQDELDNSMAELEAKIAETNEYLTVSTDSLMVKNVELDGGAAQKLWRSVLGVSGEVDRTDPEGLLVLDGQGSVKFETEPVTRLDQENLATSIRVFNAKGECLASLQLVGDSYEEVSDFTLCPRNRQVTDCQCCHAASSPSVGTPTGVGDSDPKPTDGKPAPLRNRWTLKDAVELLAGIAHYTLRVEQDSVTDSIEIGLETCMDLEEIANRARLAPEMEISTWGTHWHGNRGNLRILHTCGDRCGKRSS